MVGEWAIEWVVRKAVNDRESIMVPQLVMRWQGVPKQYRMEVDTK